LLIKFILGVFLTATVAAPLRTIEFFDINSYSENFRQQAERAAQEGTESTVKQMAQLIKGKSEAYILDKAVSLGLEIEVEVTLSSSDPPIPKCAIIKGTVSPYAKVKLAEYITAGLDMQRDEIIWT